MKMPTTSWPCCLSSQALTAESTPPDSPTTTRCLPMARIIRRGPRHTVGMDDFSDWIGRSETRHDVFGATPVAALNATLDHPALDVAPRHAAAAAVALAVLPAAAPPERTRRPTATRSAAASCRRCRCRGACGPAASSSSARRCAWATVSSARSTIDDVTVKEGRSGPLVFVTVRHEIRVDGAAEPALVEFHDIVYRDAQQPGDAEPPPQPAPQGAAWQREIVPDDVLLFRYSALTFNGHRIHYDRRYVTEVEGYPGLIVHGPLIATLLMDLLRRELPDARGGRLPLQGRAADLRPAPLPRQRRSARATPCGCGRRTTKAG